MNALKSTKVIINFSAFAITCIFLPLGWITEPTWFQMMLTILGLHNGARVAEGYIATKNGNNK